MLEVHLWQHVLQRMDERMSQLLMMSVCSHYLSAVIRHWVRPVAQWLKHMLVTTAVNQATSLASLLLQLCENGIWPSTRSNTTKKRALTAICSGVRRVGVRWAPFTPQNCSRLFIRAKSIRTHEYVRLLLDYLHGNATGNKIYTQQSLLHYVCCTQEPLWCQVIKKTITCKDSSLLRFSSGRYIFFQLVRSPDIPLQVTERPDGESPHKDEISRCWPVRWQNDNVTENCSLHLTSTNLTADCYFMVLRASCTRNSIRIKI